MFSFFSKKAKAEKEAADEYIREGDRLAEEVMKKQRARFMSEAVLNDELAPFVEAADLKNLYIWFEMPFLWGYFHEYVQTQKFATNGFSRIMVHLMYWLTKRYGYSFEQARISALEMDDRYNRDEPTFMTLARYGMDAFHDRTPDAAMVASILALAQAYAKKFVPDSPESPSGTQRPAKVSLANDELECSSNPGAHEAYLLKRLNNPYFPRQRRIISTEALKEAKRIDCEELALAKQRLDAILNEVDDLPSLATVADLHRIREEIDDLIQFAVSIGGSAKEIATKADQLREAVIMAMRQAFSDDKETLENIEKADAYHKDHVRKFYTPIVARILREKGPVPTEEMIPAILSEDAMTISIVLDLLPKDERDGIRVAALMLMRQALEEGYRDPQFEEKRAALSD